MREKWKNVLEPYAALYEAIASTVEGLDDDDLATLLYATEHPTVTNCGWSTYKVAPILSELVTEEQKGRKVRAERAQR